MFLHICTFEAVGKITPGMTFEGFKKKVLKAGRFSVFEATVNQRTAKLYTRLCEDPELEIEPQQYPWTSVRKRKK